MSDYIIKRLREAVAEHPLSPIHGYAADITALLDRLDDFEENGAQAVRWAPSSAHWSNELRRLFGSDAREGINNLEEQLRDAIVKLNAAERECERLREDAERLDWIASIARINSRHGTGYVMAIEVPISGPHHFLAYSNDDVRAAIDAAMAKDQK